MNPPSLLSSAGGRRGRVGFTENLQLSNGHQPTSFTSEEDQQLHHLRQTHRAAMQSRWPPAKLLEHQSNSPATPSSEGSLLSPFPASINLP